MSKPVLPSFLPGKPLHYENFLAHVFDSSLLFSSHAKPLDDVNLLHEARPQEGLFYTIMGVFLLLAVIRLAYRKYFSDMFRAFFNPTLSQRQLREQLSQTPFPAFLLNAFFGVSMGVYLFLVLQQFNYIENRHPLYLVPVFIVLVILIYLVKYLFLKASGWLFGNPELLEGYIFVLYLINKVMGVLLLPFMLVLAFSMPDIAWTALHISIILIVLLFGYRYIRMYSLLKNHIYFSRFHFFLYLCAFEIAPVAVIGKLVLIWLNGAA